MFTCSEKTACVSSRGSAMMRILLNAYQHDHVYDCPEIIKQYTDEYTDRGRKNRHRLSPREGERSPYGGMSIRELSLAPRCTCVYVQNHAP